MNLRIFRPVSALTCQEQARAEEVSGDIEECALEQSLDSNQRAEVWLPPKLPLTVVDGAIHELCKRGWLVEVEPSDGQIQKLLLSWKGPRLLGRRRIRYE